MTILNRLFKPKAPPEHTPLGYRKFIDEDKFALIRDQYIDADPCPGFSKYLDFDHWIVVAQNHYNLMKIPQGDRLAILDIGTGAGYFPFVCHKNGHRVMATDIPGHGFYSSMIELLGVERKEFYINRMKPFPDFGRRFDLVTAFAICFNCHATEDLWGVPEWKFFVDDMLERVLTRTGRLFLNFNREPNGEFFSDDLRELFAGFGASTEDDKVVLSQPGARR